MELTNLEAQIIDELLKRTSATVANRDDLVKSIQVLDRDETGAGVFTELKKSQVLKVTKEPKTFKWGKVGAVLNGKIDVGFLLDIKDGCLTDLEGYTYSDNWPDEIIETEFHDIPSGHLVRSVRVAITSRQLACLGAEGTRGLQTVLPLVEMLSCHDNEFTTTSFMPTSSHFRVAIAAVCSIMIEQRKLFSGCAEFTKDQIIGQVDAFWQRRIKGVCNSWNFKAYFLPPSALLRD